MSHHNHPVPHMTHDVGLPGGCCICGGPRHCCCVHDKVHPAVRRLPSEDGVGAQWDPVGGVIWITEGTPGQEDRRVFQLSIADLERIYRWAKEQGFG